MADIKSLRKHPRKYRMAIAPYAMAQTWHGMGSSQTFVSGLSQRFQIHQAPRLVHHKEVYRYLYLFHSPYHLDIDRIRR